MSSVRHSPAAQRNRGPILDVLRPYLSAGSGGGDVTVLEVASGGGTHAAHLAKNLPNVTVQPTEFDRGLLGAISACAAADGVSDRVRAPHYLDVSKPQDYLSMKGANSKFDAILCVNLCHIAPFRCTEGLFELAGAALHSGSGRLFTYGPYAENGVLSPASNVNFDAMLRTQCPEWGIRDIRDLTEEASKHNLALEASHEMPANNKVLVWKKL